MNLSESKIPLKHCASSTLKYTVHRYTDPSKADSYLSNRKILGYNCVSFLSPFTLKNLGKARERSERSLVATVVIWVISFEVTDYRVRDYLKLSSKFVQQQPSFPHARVPVIFMPI